MWFGYLDLWDDDVARVYLKTIFGNRKNWRRWMMLNNIRALKEMWAPWTKGWEL